MALQGTIETFALPEVLRLLGAGGKSGRLRLNGDRGSGSIWVDGGKVMAAEATGIRESTTPTGVVFELLRYAEGSFTFDDDQTYTRPGNPQDIEVLLGEAERQLADWREIEAVVPSLAVGLALADELPDEDVTLDASGWKAVVAVARGGDVAAIADALDLEELAACRRAKDLVEAGLAFVTEAGPRVDDEPGVVEGTVADDAVPVSAPVVVGQVDQVDPVDVASPFDAGSDTVDPSPIDAWVPAPDAAEAQYDPVDGAAVGPDAGQPVLPARESFAPGGYDGPSAPESADAGGYGRGAFRAEPSSARADLDAMASGFGLTDAVPARGDEGFAHAAGDHGGSFEGGSFEGGGFEGGFDAGGFESGAFESGGFDQAFASDPSQDPAFSFAAPDQLADAPAAGMAPGAALFADDLHGAIPPTGQPQPVGAPLAVADDGGDAAEVARQLANLSPKAARAVAAAARATTVEEREAALAEVTSEGEEPINRGLLLKFLSSVQT